MRVKHEECVMVAAHAWDNRGGKKLGMKTVYVYRWTDDVNEDMDAFEGENDAFLESMVGLDPMNATCGDCCHSAR